MDERLQFVPRRLAGEEMADIPSTGIAGGRSSRNSSEEHRACPGVLPVVSKAYA
jgi:hypothetical protein